MPRTTLRRALSLIVLTLPAVACGSQAAGESGLPPKLGLCASCHNNDGIATLPAHPHLAGQDAAYMRLALEKYRSGERKHAPMKAAANALTQADLDRIVDYYAALPRDGKTQ
jgi:cytochrome c553